MDTDESKRINITVPKQYVELDDSVWDDIEKYLFQGFLTNQAEIHGQFFVFKTVNHHELRLIEFMRPFSFSSEEKKKHFRSAFIAYSVFMINGNNVLYERDKNIQKLIKIINRFNSSHQEKIFENLAALNERASRAYPLTEVYSFENRSRFKWYQVNKSPLNSIINTGIAGTESIGLNHAQSLWTALNNIYDNKDQSEREWANAKFVGSCMAGKGIRSIDEKDKMRHERERVEREELKMKVLRSYLNRTSSVEGLPVETVQLPDGRTAEVVNRFRADSAEELAKQLSAALNGEKDAHDLAVEAHFRKMQERVQEIEKERRKLISSSASKPSDGSSYSVISKNEAEERIKRLKEAMLGVDQQIIPDISKPDY